jgi:hypothetical protein
VVRVIFRTFAGREGGIFVEFLTKRSWDIFLSLGSASLEQMLGRLW